FVAAGGQDEVECTNLSATSKAAEMDLGGTNVTLTEGLALGQDGWFVNFNTGDLRLNNPHEDLLEAALWLPDDPATDIGDDARPRGPNNQDVAGADVPTSGAE